MAYPWAFSIPGLLTDYVDEDYIVGPFPAASTIIQFSPSLISAPGVGGALDVSLHAAAGGGGDSIDASFAAGEYNQSETGSLQVNAGGYAYVRVTAESGDPMSLGGFFMVEDSAPVIDVGSEPLTIAEVKKHLKIADEITEHDSNLGNLLSRVREEAERYVGPIVAQNVTYTYDAFPSGRAQEWWDGVRDGAITADESGEIELPDGKIRSVTSITTYDDSDNATVMSSANYYADVVTNRIALRTGQVWPTVLRTRNGVVVVVAAGYALPEDVPGDLKERLKERVEQRWNARLAGEADPKIDAYFYGTRTIRKFGARNLFSGRA